MPSSLSELRCASWLVYATRATDEPAARIKTLILNIKTDKIDSRTGLSFVSLAIERAKARLTTVALEFFGGHPLLVPVPGSGLTKAHTVWPAHRVCEELVRHGLGEDILTAIRRTTAVSKSAGSSARPTFQDHLRSLSVQPRLVPPSRLIVVDDVVTSGTTMLACAVKLAAAFPSVPVRGFALARVQSSGNPPRVFEPIVERIVINGDRCARTGI